MGNHACFSMIHRNKHSGGEVLPTCTKEKVKSFLHNFDTNGDGMLNFNEMKNMFIKLGVKAPFWEALKVMIRADENGDFRISDYELDVLVKFMLEHGISISC